MSGDAECENITDTGYSEELDDEISDAMLGGLRRGLITIRNNAKETLERCKTDVLRNEMEERLKSSTIKLIRSEKSYLETARIVAQVVDEISSDYEDEQDINGFCQKILHEKMEASITSHCGDAEIPNRVQNISVFRPTFANSDSILNTAKKMSSMFTDRIKNFEDSLTEAHLEKHPKFKALQAQIDLAEACQERNYSHGDGYGNTEIQELNCQSDMTFYEPEESQVDYAVLPSVDPISKKPIQTAWKNKYCNHIFEETSIREFMAVNPDDNCPMHGCKNKRKLNTDHFIFDPILNGHIHEKHLR